MSDTKTKKLELFGGEVVIKFFPRTHRYEVSVDGGPFVWVPSVTTITGMINKGDGMLQWAVNCALRWLTGKVQSADFDLTEGLWATLTQEAKSQWRKVRDDAADHGTAVHEWVEAYIAWKLCGEEGGSRPPVPEEPKVRAGIESFLKWEIQHKVEYVYTERLVYSPRHHYAGTVDIVAYVDGVLCVLDVKTSKSVYDEYALQVWAYAKALNEEFQEKVENCLILHIPKAGGFAVHDLGAAAQVGGATAEENVKAFLGALALHQRLRQRRKG